jgi:hypothetical protein
MTKEFDRNLDGLIEQLHTREPRTHGGKEYSPRQVRSFSKGLLRRTVADCRNDLWYSPGDEVEAAKALGYYNSKWAEKARHYENNWLEKARRSCRNHLLLRRYLSLRYLARTAVEAAKFSAELGVALIIFAPYRAGVYLKEKSEELYSRGGKT